MSFYEFAWYFTAYSFIGWVIEVAYHAFTLKKVINRGYLNGPVCPIYGFGMTSVIALFSPLADNIPLLFVMGTLLCTLVEFIGGFILDKSFHMRWWDYSNVRFNINGYICLRFSLLWGAAVVAALKLLHPPLAALVAWVPHGFGVAVIVIMALAYTADTLASTQKAIGMSRSIRELEMLAQTLKGIGDGLSSAVGETVFGSERIAQDTMDTISEMADNAKDAIDQAVDDAGRRMEELRASMEKRKDALVEKLKAYRAYRAFPALSASERIRKLREQLEEFFGRDE